MPIYRAAKLDERQWLVILAAFNNSELREGIERLREKGNIAQPATELFGERLQWYAHERANIVFRKLNMPYRLTRIGSWAKGDRNARPLAIVDWPSGKQMQLPMRLPRLPSP